MLLRRLWRKFSKPVVMENSSLPSTLRRCFFLGLGLGTGFAIGVYIAKKVSQTNYSHELVLALNDVSHEIRELRTSALLHYERTSLAFSSDKTKKLYHRVSSHEVTTKTECLELDNTYESASEEDYYDLFDDNNEQTLKKESLQEKRLLHVDDLLKECDALTKNVNSENNDKEMRILEDLLAREPNNVEVLWRFARAHKNKANSLTRREDQEEKKNITYKGMKFVDKALEINWNHGEAHMWYAILLGITAEYEPLKERAELAHKYKRHIAKAIELKPTDPTVYHLMGRWCFEVAMLSWWERQAASIFIGELPMSTVDEALSNFQQSEKLNPGNFKSNSLYIGKCYQKLGDSAKAKEWMKKALDIPVSDAEDKKAHEEATTILASL